MKCGKTHIRIKPKLTLQCPEMSQVPEPAKMTCINTINFTTQILYLALLADIRNWLLLSGFLTETCPKASTIPRK